MDRIFRQQEHVHSSVRQLRTMIKTALVRIEARDAELAQRIRDRIGPESSWTSQTYELVLDLEREPRGSMG